MTQTKAELLETKHQGDIRLGDANSSHYVGFKAPATVGSSLVWTLPAADGTANYLLKTDGSGNLGWTQDNTGVSLSGSTNNTIATVSGANALVGEATFTYDGASTLEVKPTSATPAVFVGDSDRTSAGQHLAEFRGYWDGTNVARIVFRAGDDTTNKDDGVIALFTTSSGGSSTERMRIDSTGKILIGGITEPFSTTGYRKFQIGHTDGGWVNLARTGIPADGNHLGAIQGFTKSSDGTYHPTVGIDYLADGTTSNSSKPSRIGFFTTSASSTTKAERLRIGSSGQLGIAGANYGTSGQVLTSGGASAAPAWADAAGGGATPTVKTANYTAASGDLVVVNGSGLTITLPSSPSVADSVEIRILGSRYCTVARNGSNIESTASNFYIDTFDGHTKFIYTDSTRGWLVA